MNNKQAISALKLLMGLSGSDPSKRDRDKKVSLEDLTEDGDLSVPKLTAAKERQLKKKLKKKGKRK